MKKKILFFNAILISAQIFSQTAGPNNPSAAVTVPSSACLACPGSVWMNETNVFLLDNNISAVGLMPNGNCFQSTCYYSRYLYASNFGFSIPGTATITGITVDIHRQSGNPNSATDSTIKLVKNSIPSGANRAMLTPWPTSAAYYNYGSSSDLWGNTWAPTDINVSTFGVYLKIYNMDGNVTTTPSVNHIRITIDYTMPTGVHYSVSAFPSAMNVYQTEDEINVSLILDQAVSKAFLKVYNAVGQVELQKEFSDMPTGIVTENFCTADLNSGIYFVQFSSGNNMVTKKVLIH